tara:strand:+ start:287 stop:505 length:219 start_codon:yes stop_codon:yes gene_type:complete
MEESFEDYMKRQIDEGYISENGHPIKCECGCTEFKQVDQHYGEGHIEEYSLECTNQECLKKVGSWSFGHWQV